MSEEFKLEIINPEKLFLTKENVVQVVVPAFEGEIGILQNHISIISFLKPGVLKILTKSEEDKYYIEDGIVEFKNNNLSILTSNIIKISEFDKNKIKDLLIRAESEINKNELDDQKKYLISQKIEILKTLSIS